MNTISNERDKAVPVAYQYYYHNHGTGTGQWLIVESKHEYEQMKVKYAGNNDFSFRELYAILPSQPVAVLDAMPETVSEDGNDIDYMEPSAVYELGKTHGWNACRAAMLAAPGKPVAENDTTSAQYESLGKK